MPIIVAGSAVSENYLGLVNNILRECNEPTVENLTNPSPITQLAMDYLNYTVEDIYTRADWPWAQAEHGFGPAPSDDTPTANYYYLPDDFDRMAADPFYPGQSLGYVEPGRLDHLRTDVTQTGVPTHYTLWQDCLRLVPAASDSFCENKTVLGTDGNVYTCFLDHTAAAATRPITGADWAYYWVLDAQLTTAPAWVLGTDYEDGLIRYRYWRRPEQMANDGDYPDLPDKAIECLKIGARARLKEYLETDDSQFDYALYESKIDKLLGNRRQQVRGHRWRLWRNG